MRCGTVSSTQASARQMPVALVVMTPMFLVIASVPRGPGSSELRNTDVKDVNDMGMCRNLCPANIKYRFSSIMWNVAETGRIEKSRFKK